MDVEIQLEIVAGDCALLVKNPEPDGEISERSLVAETCVGLASCVVGQRQFDLGIRNAC